jgi:hypothetical protein
MTYASLKSSEIDVETLQRLMDKYISPEFNWSKDAFSGLRRRYMRNLEDEGDGKSNFVRYIDMF